MPLVDGGRNQRNDESTSTHGRWRTAVPDGGNRRRLERQPTSKRVASRCAAVGGAPASDTYKSVYDGWKWWHVYCYRCHGVDAVGTTNAPNLIDPESEALLRRVPQGRPERDPRQGDAGVGQAARPEAGLRDPSLRSRADRQGAAAGTAGRSRTERRALGPACGLALAISDVGARRREGWILFRKPAPLVVATG